MSATRAELVGEVIQAVAGERAGASLVGGCHGFFEVFLVSAVEIDQLVVFDLDDAGGQRRYKLAVMADKNQRAIVMFQRQVERFDGFHVEMVGGFVHQQYIGDPASSACRTAGGFSRHRSRP